MAGLPAARREAHYGRAPSSQPAPLPPRRAARRRRLLRFRRRQRLGRYLRLTGAVRLGPIRHLRRGGCAALADAEPYFAGHSPAHRPPDDAGPKPLPAALHPAAFSEDAQHARKHTCGRAPSAAHRVLAPHPPGATDSGHGRPSLVPRPERFCGDPVRGGKLGLARQRRGQLSDLARSRYSRASKHHLSAPVC